MKFLTDIKKQQPDGRVVIHCVAGVNRSGLIVCAACLVLEQKLVVEVVEDCLQKRQSAFLWNKSLQRQLCELAQHHNLLGPQPEGYDDWSEPLAEKRIITRSKLAAKKQGQLC